MSTNRDRKRKTKWENQQALWLKKRTLKNYVFNLIEWKNLPSTVNKRYLMKTLYYHGKILWFNHPSFGLLALEYTGSETLNMYGEHTHFIVNRPMISDYRLDTTNSVQMFNNMSKLPTVDIVNNYARRLYRLERTIDINSDATRTPIMLMTDKSRLLSLQQVYDAITSGENAIFADKDTLSGTSVESLDLQVQYYADKLTDLRHDLQNDFYDIFGIANANTDKKERLNTVEVNSNNEIVELARHTWLDTLSEAIEQINEMFKDVLEQPIVVKYKIDRGEENGVLHSATEKNSEGN